MLLEYIGDEVMAMWGAPRPQEDHAERAVRAALLMQRRLPVVDAKWAERVGGPVRVGVGIHTGKAWVGKVGTSFKFKYGPQGHTVNLASRVQGATKYLRTPVLVTGATRARLSAEIACRQLTSVRVRNINQPVELFEIPAEQPADYAKLCAGYNAALTAADARTAIRSLGPLLCDFPDDGPSLLLHARAVEAHLGRTKFDPVWELPGK